MNEPSVVMEVEVTILPIIILIIDILPGIDKFFLNDGWGILY
jgi:hypothetical protein